MQELEYFSSVLLCFTLSQLHSLDFSKLILNFCREMQELEYFSSRFKVQGLILKYLYKIDINTG